MSAVPVKHFRNGFLRKIREGFAGGKEVLREVSGLFFFVRGHRCLTAVSCAEYQRFVWGRELEDFENVR
jgi:hypothetical protein